MRKLVKLLKANKPSVLTFVGAGGLIVTAVMAYKSAEAVQCSYHEALHAAFDEERELTKKEKAWVYVKTLWPTFTIGAVSVALIVAGDRGHVKRNHAALAAYYISETALKDYQEEVIKELGEKKEKEVRDRVTDKHAKEAVNNGPTYIISDSDRPLVHDLETNCIFRYGYDRLQLEIFKINKDLDDEKLDGISVYDFYERLGVKPPPGEKWPFVGWNKKYYIDPNIYSTLEDIDGTMTPVMVMEYRFRPMYDYDVYG